MTDTTTTVDDLNSIDILRAAVQNVQDNLDEESADKYELLNAAAQIAIAVDDYEDVTQRVDDSLVGFAYDWSRLSQLVNAQYRIQLWHEVVAKSSKSKALQDLTVTVKTLRGVAKSKAQRLICNWDRGSSSDSMSNAISSIEAEVNSRFVQYFAGDTLTVKEAQ